MPSKTANYALNVYNLTTDQAETFSSYRDAQSGVGSASNMNLIDTALANIQNQITSFSKGTIYVIATQESANTYSVLGVTGITAYGSGGLGIVLSVDVTNTGAATLNINGLGFRNLSKIDSTGSVVAMAAGDIILNTPYYFIYDGVRWVLVGGGSSTLGAGLTYDSLISSLTVGGNPAPEANPSAINLVGADGVSPFLALWAFGNNGPVMNTYRAKGTHAIPTGVVAGSTIGLWRSLGYDPVTAAYWPNAFIKMISTETWDDSNEGTEIQIWTTPKTSVSQQQDVTIDSTGISILSGETYQINGVPHAHEIYAAICDKKANTTDGGTFTSGSWQTRDLNTELSDVEGIVSIAANQFVLAAGTYRCHIVCPAYKVGGNIARIYNVTDVGEVLVGNSAYNDTDGGYAFITGTFTIGTAKTLEIQHTCQVTANTFGFGAATGGRATYTGLETYTVAEFWKQV